MEATNKQKGYLASLIKDWAEDGSYPTLNKIWQSIPRNNEKYPNKVCDYREIILADKLSGLSGEEASYIINWFLGKTDKYGNKFRTKYAFQYLIRLNLVKVKKII